jgi:hypothetical protein
MLLAFPHGDNRAWRLRVSLVTLILAGAALASLAGIRSFAQGQNQTQAPATLTPEEIESKHSQIFPFGRQPIEQLLSQTVGDVYIHGSFLSGQYQEFYTERPNPSNLARLEMEGLTCGCSLVVLGKVGTGISHLTADKGFLYTDWGFLAEEVIRNNPDSSVAVGGSITIVKAGGRLKIQGRMVYATDDFSPEFQSGDEYLLFLYFIPKTGAYAAYRSIAYAFRDGKTTQLSMDPATKVHTAALDQMDKNTLLSAARASVATIKWPGCKGIIQ